MKFSNLEFCRFSLLVVLTVESLAGCKRDPLADVPDHVKGYVPLTASPVDTKMIVALVDGNLQDFVKAIQEGANLNITLQNRQTLVQYAIEKPRPEYISVMTSRWNLGETRSYFLEAASKGNDKVLKAFPSNLKVQKELMQEALMKMAGSGYLPVDDVTPSYAGDDGRRLPESVKKSLDFLLANGAQINKPSMYGQTPLMEAASTNRAEMAYELLLRGADWKAKNKSGKTALDVARASRSGGKLYGSIIPLLEQWQAGKISAPRSKKPK